MSSKYLATGNMIIRIKPPVTGQITLISQPSSTVTINGSGVYAGPLQFTVSNIQSPDCGHAVPGQLPLGVIQPTAVSTMVGDQMVIREGDKADGLVSVGAMEMRGNTAVSCAVTFTVEILDAGQTEVKGS